MTFKEYEKYAQRTQQADMEPSDKVLHAAFGLCSEAGEVASIFQHAIQEDKGVAPIRVIDELGDVLWFVTELINTFGLSLEDVAQCNIDKLITRYPKGFDAKRSEQRHSFGEDEHIASI